MDYLTKCKVKRLNKIPAWLLLTRLHTCKVKGLNKGKLVGLRCLVKAKSKGKLREKSKGKLREGNHDLKLNLCIR